MRKKLARYNLPEPILRGWEDRFEGRLLPLQYRAIDEYGLIDGESLLISAPTSSGKTFCGELAIIRAVRKRQKAIFLTPLKAVTEEKFRQFSDCYGKLGLRVVIGTRDHPEFDADIENGRFDIAVMVYEKFNSLLIINFDLMAQVGTLVIDELQVMADENRGAPLELALTKLLYSEYKPQIVALSAVLGEATGLAEWLGCRLLLEKARPVELRRGVASEGRFCYRCHNSGEIGEEEIEEGEDHLASLFENLRQSLGTGSIEEGQRTFKYQVLVFLKSRQETMAAARKFAEFASLEHREENRIFFEERLADEEQSSLLENLKSLLYCGVAFHNADLTATQRTVVEDGYRAGMVAVIFATTTLATGINLPAATVYMEAQKYRQKEHTGRAGLEPLSWPEYESMSGRAGRIGWIGLSGRREVGRAVLFASGELEKSILWDYYIDKRPEPLGSRLDSCDRADIVVDLLSSGLVHHPEDVSHLLLRSYHTHLTGGRISIGAAVYDGLLEKDFLIREGGNEITATLLARAVAVSGLSVAGAEYIIESCRQLQTDSDMQAVYRLLHSPEGRSIYIPHNRRGLGAVHLFPDTAEENALIRQISSLRRELTGDEIGRLRLTFLLFDWMAGMALLDIENDYQLYPGLMESIGHQSRWLLSSAAAVIHSHNRFSDLPVRLQRLAFSAGTGLPLELKEIYDETEGLLFRSEFLRLRNEGISTLDRLMEVGPSVWRKIVTSDSRRQKVMEKLAKIKERKMQICLTHPAHRAADIPTIDIDGTPVRERFLVRIDGRPIGLTLKSFKYLVSLAWSRLTRDHGWLYKEDLERGFNQARYLYRLRQEIGREFLPDWPLYENNRSGYYRLVADREKIKVNVTALSENPDYEIRRMAGDLTPNMAG